MLDDWIQIARREDEEEEEITAVDSKNIQNKKMGRRIQKATENAAR